MDSETRRSLIVLGAVGAAVAVAIVARDALGIEWSAESVRETVLGFGFWGPLVFVLLMGFRSFLFVPSQIMLVAGGLIFGAAGGAIFGALGMMISGAGAFFLARYAGREAVLANVPESMRWPFTAAGSRAGAAVVVVGTGYPVGPVSAFHAGAGLTAMGFPVFLAALAAGSLVRAGTYSWFGSALVGDSGGRLLVAGLALLAVALLPLLHPRTRGWLRSRLEDGARGDGTA